MKAQLRFKLADLVGRKVVKDQGKNLSVLIGLMKETLAQVQANAELGRCGRKRLQMLSKFCLKIASK